MGFRQCGLNKLHSRSANSSIVVTPIRVTTAFANPQDIENQVGSVDAASEPKWPNTEFFVWRTLKWFEMFWWVSPFVGNDLVEFGRDTVTRVIIEAIEILSCRIG